MKNILIVTCAFFLSLTAFAQENEWALYSSVDGVEVYTMEVDCDAKNIPSQKAIIIKVVNTTANRIQIEWDKAIWYNGEEVVNSSDDENHDVLQLSPNENKVGSCDVPRGELYIFKDFILYESDTKLSKFELQNIKVIKL